MKTLVNLTPHAIHFVDEEGKPISTVEPSGLVARAAQVEETIGMINGIPIVRQTFGQVVDLPEPKDGVRYIVSVLTAQAAPSRTDLYIPAQLVRNEKGQIVGCRALATLSKREDWVEDED